MTAHKLTTFTSTDIAAYIADPANLPGWVDCWATIAEVVAEHESAQPDWEPDAEEQAQIEAHERTRAQRWSALTVEEQDMILEASEEEAGLRYDVKGGW